MKFPKCSSIIVPTEAPMLRHIRAFKCLTCGWYLEEGAEMNRLQHAAWVKEDNPRKGIVKEIIRGIS